MLPLYARERAELGVTHVTVTMNAVDPAVGGRIYRFVDYMGTRFRGEAAASILMANQMTGIRMLADLGIVVKVNIVPETVTPSRPPGDPKSERAGGVYYQYHAAHPGKGVGLRKPAHPEQQGAHRPENGVRGGDPSNAPLPPVQGRRGGHPGS
jgi:hypothetical protein